MIKGRGTRSMSSAEVRNLSNSWTVKERLKGVGWASSEDIVGWGKDDEVDVGGYQAG